MPILTCHVDERTHAILEAFSQRTGRAVEDLAEAAISDAAIKADRESPSPVVIRRGDPVEPPFGCRPLP